VDGLLGNLGRARHVGDSDVLMAAFGEQAGGGVRYESPRTRLLALAQSAALHPVKP
jgi:hypothetical protein